MIFKILVLGCMVNIGSKHLVVEQVEEDKYNNRIKIYSTEYSGVFFRNKMHYCKRKVKEMHRRCHRI